MYVYSCITIYEHINPVSCIVKATAWIYFLKINKTLKGYEQDCMVFVCSTYFATVFSTLLVYISLSLNLLP